VAIEAGSAFQQFAWSRFGWEGKVAMVATTGSIGPFASDPDLLQQAYITSEPCLADAKGIATTFLPARDAGWNPYAAMAVVRGEEKAAPWARAFREATIAGWRHYLEDPSAANAEIARLNPDMAGERLACVTERQKPFVTGRDGVGAMTAERWSEVATALTSVGQPVDATGAWATP
jgi:NitT/TauT family transport system substrate-binding protein